MDQGLEFETFFHQLFPITEGDERLAFTLNPDNFFNDNCSNGNVPNTNIYNNGTVQIPSNGVNGYKFGTVDEVPTIQIPSPPFMNTQPNGNVEHHKQLSEGDKEKVKRRNQNLACRNYRQRKKEYVQDLENRVASLQEEVEQLKKENANLRKGDGLEPIHPDIIAMLTEMKQILSKLTQAVEKDMDDRTISYYLQLFFLALEKKMHAMENEIEKMVNPFTQAKLATLGYVSSSSTFSISSRITGPSADGWWSTLIEEANISEEQSQKITELRERHVKVDSELKQEQGMLDKAIKEFYVNKLRVMPTLSTNAQNLPALDITEVIEFTRQLNCLKKNILAQKSVVLDIQMQLTRILKPRQHALLLLKIYQSCRGFDWPAHAQMLRSAWQLFKDIKI
jgi:transposase-like protein